MRLSYIHPIKGEHDMHSVGKRIKTTRLVQGLSQVELAKIIDVSQPTVANWENGSHIPRQAVLNRLSGILKISAHWLLSGDQDQNGFTQIPRQYLETPIKHVPILAWPSYEDALNNGVSAGAVQDYLSISTLANSPFALLINNIKFGSEFPVGTAVIFDADFKDMEDDSYYLFAEDQNITLRQYKLSTRKKEKENLPLAKALLSIRRH